MSYIRKCYECDTPCNDLFCNDACRERLYKRLNITVTTDPINWEARRWELYSKFVLLEENNTVADALLKADAAIKFYKGE